jgi:hypothetical protein
MNGKKKVLLTSIGILLMSILDVYASDISFREQVIYNIDNKISIIRIFFNGKCIIEENEKQIQLDISCDEFSAEGDEEWEKLAKHLGKTILIKIQKQKAYQIEISLSKGRTVTIGKDQNFDKSLANKEIADIARIMLARKIIRHYPLFARESTANMAEGIVIRKLFLNNNTKHLFDSAVVWDTFICNGKRNKSNNHTLISSAASIADKPQPGNAKASDYVKYEATISMKENTSVPVSMAGKRTSFQKYKQGQSKYTAAFVLGAGAKKIVADLTQD